MVISQPSSDYNLLTQDIYHINWLDDRIFTISTVERRIFVHQPYHLKVKKVPAPCDCQSHKPPPTNRLAPWPRHGCARCVGCFWGGE